MGAEEFFSYKGSDGLRENHRADIVGYHQMQVIESIALSYPGVDLMMVTWLASTDHSSTLMGDDFQDVGVRVELSTHSGQDV